MKVTLDELEEVAQALSIKVSYDDLKSSRGGSCRVKETRRIIINKHLPNTEKVNLLARELGAFELDGVEVPEKILKKIRHEAERR